MPKRFSAEDDDFVGDHFDDLGKDDHAGGFDAGDRPAAEKGRRQATRAERKKGAKEDPLKHFGYVVKLFVLENIKAVNYRDIAELAGISPEELKEALEKCGIRVTDDKTTRWADIDVGTFVSVSDCARCCVQRRHNSFIVGVNDCRLCFERNIKHWIKIGEPVRISFQDRD